MITTVDVVEKLSCERTLREIASKGAESGLVGGAVRRTEGEAAPERGAGPTR